MNDSMPVRRAIASALSKFFGGIRVDFRDNETPRSGREATLEFFLIHLPQKDVVLAVSDDRLAELSNTHNIEDGHPYKDDDALSSALLSEMEGFNVTALITGARPGERVLWDSRSASFSGLRGD